MGASNALRVYAAWGGLPPKSHQVLVYMALVSIDGDAEPWYGLGHDDIGRRALNLDVPDAEAAEADPKAAKARAEALRKVRRHMTPLHRRGAIETTRKATFGHRGPAPARYRLYLDGPKSADVIPLSRRRA